MQQISKPFMAEIQKAKRNGKAVPGTADGAPVPVALPTGPLNVDNREVMKAIGELGEKLDRFLTMDSQQIDHIQTEIADISGRIKATKVEMAALRHPLAGEDKFEQASQELTVLQQN